MLLSGKLPSSFQSIIEQAFEALSHAQVVDRLWAKDHTHHRHAVGVQLGRDQAATVNAVVSALTKTASSKRLKITRR